MDLQHRSQLATEIKYGARHLGMPLAAPHPRNIPFPDGLAPKPAPNVGRDGTLPHADVVVMMDTVAEAAAAADVLTPGYASPTWQPYLKNFDKLLPQIAQHAPARKSRRLGSYMLTMIGDKRVLVYKTELHMHEDALKQADGYTLPIKDALKQIIADARPRVFLTTGTSGGVYPVMPLGDVVISRAAKFDCKKDFVKAAFNGHCYESHWDVPTKYFAEAEHLMAGYFKDWQPGRNTMPVAHCDVTPDALRDRPPAIHHDGDHGVPLFHPVLTTDYFEFGSSKNELWKDGVAVEMDDACLGLACSELPHEPPHWACVRNLSDPVINGALSEQLQCRCAEWFYSHWGFWTSVNSSLAAWAIAAGL